MHRVACGTVATARFSPTCDSVRHGLRSELQAPLEPPTAASGRPLHRPHNQQRANPAPPARGRLTCLRQTQLHQEISRLRADLAALNSERELLHELSRTRAAGPAQAVVQPASAAMSAEASAAARSSWALPQRI